MLASNKIRGDVKNVRFSLGVGHGQHVKGHDTVVYVLCVQHPYFDLLLCKKSRGGYIDQSLRERTGVHLSVSTLVRCPSRLRCSTTVILSQQHTCHTRSI